MYKKQAIWIKRLVKEIFNKNIKNKLWKDIAENENKKGRSKYMDIKYIYIQDEII